MRRLILASAAMVAASSLAASIDAIAKPIGGDVVPEPTIRDRKRVSTFETLRLSKPRVLPRDQRNAGISRARNF